MKREKREKEGGREVKRENRRPRMRSSRWIEWSGEREEVEVDVDADVTERPREGL